MARKLRFFHDQVWHTTKTLQSLQSCLRSHTLRPYKLWRAQVQKSELIVGARMGDDTWELDELEVRVCAIYLCLLELP